MKILVTGGAGYIGSILVPLFLYRGHEVVAIDNFMYGQISLLGYCHSPKFRIVRGDVRNDWVMREWVRWADVIFPLACITGAPACDADAMTALSINLDAIEMLLKMRSREQIVIFPTTNSGYGIGKSGAYCTEESPLRPVSLYGRLKVEAEQTVLGSPNTATLRLATVFGVSPRMRLDLLVNDFVFRALSDGYVVLFEPNARRNYIHVFDVARAFRHCLDNFEAMRGQAYNVGLSDANLTKRELCQEIKKQIPSLAVIESNVGEDPDKRDYLVSNEKIERTGFKPMMPLQEGIAELIRSYPILQRSVYKNA